MSFRIVSLLLLIAFSNSIFAEEEEKAPSPSPSPTPSGGFLGHVMNIFHKHKDKPDDKKARKTLDLTMDLTPQPLKLSEAHELQVTLKLTNHTGKIVQLDFPTTQRIEVLLHNDAGKLVTQWSEDQSFINDPGYVTINPLEHVEYTVTISGRDLAPGKSYTLEGFFPNYENLKVSKTIVPQR